MMANVLLMACMAGAGYFNNPRLYAYEDHSMQEWCAISEALNEIGVEGKTYNDGKKFYYDVEDLDLSGVTVKMLKHHYDDVWIYHEEVYTYGNRSVIVTFMTDGHSRSRAIVD